MSPSETKTINQMYEQKACRVPEPIILLFAYNPATMKLSVIIPVYNEVESIQIILKRVQDTRLAKEILVVDDGSKDGTRDVLKKLDGERGVHVVLHEHNQGKGAAVRT